MADQDPWSVVSTAPAASSQAVSPSAQQNTSGGSADPWSVVHSAPAADSSYEVLDPQGRVAGLQRGNSTEGLQPGYTVGRSTSSGKMPAGQTTSSFGVRPPPPEMAPTVQQAADKYGVPLPVAHFVGSTESHWNPSAVGPPTSSGQAKGAWQFMDGTAKQYGLADPTDFASSTDAAMHKLADLYKETGDWEQAIKKYGTFSTGRGADADAAVQQNFRDYMGQGGHDIAQGVGRGLISGAGYVLGMPADIWHLLDRGYQYALTEGAAKLGLLSEEDAAELRKPMTEEEATPTFGSENITNHLMKLARSLGADTSKPTTVPGRYAETISSFLPGAGAFGAGAARQIPGALLKYGVIPGATSETAGQLTQGSPVEPYARMAGAMAPMLPGAGMAALENVTSHGPGALNSLTPTQLTRTQELLDQSRAAGAPLTVPEAVQQATNSGTRIGDIARVVEQSPKGGAVLKPFYAQRPAQTEALGRSTLDQVAPPTSEPYEVPARVQGAAEDTLTAANDARTAQVNPLYKAAATDTVPTNEMEAFLQKLDKQIAADKTGLTSAPLVDMRNALTESEAIPATATTPAQPRVPVTDIENLDNARKYFRDLPAQPAYAQKAVPKFVGSKVTALAKELGSIMEAHSPKFGAGRQLYQDITRTQFNPLKRSPVGQLAEAPGFEKQAQILFNSNPMPGSEGLIGRTVRQVAQADPEAAKSLVRMYLEKTFNEATQANLPGANQFGGPKFAAVVRGNSQQARNLEAAVRALPDGDVRWNALKRGLDIMEAMGKRQAVGSQTEFNRAIREEMKTGKPAEEILAAAGSPHRWMRLVSDAVQKFNYGRNTEQLARAFISGNVEDLRAILRSGERSLRGQAALLGALARQGSPSQQSVQP